MPDNEILEEVRDDFSSPVNQSYTQDEVNSFEAERKGQTHGQSIKLSNTIFCILRIFVWIMFLIFSSTLIVWTWHQLAPCCWKWLSDDAVHNLERILFASALISVGGKYLGKFKLMEK